MLILVFFFSIFAIELGVDIGSLDAVITVGFPYTLSGWRQQAGRAGRRNLDSLAMLICDPFPLDQVRFVFLLILLIFIRLTILILI